DPIKRLKKYMLAKDFWDEQQESQLMQEVTAEVEKAVEYFNQLPMPSPESMFDYLYETLPEAYQSQRAAVIKGENQ
ncbi:MAG TPA: thiamine pyrophosphate-dependent enzyme, partial [Candidatus Berkiella sp.]|nr:thiamine pyrophosphate-dependent enzyme [Candidatus Berkiella sp.]